VSDYVVESGASARARARRRRTLITLGLVALLLFGAFWFAYSYWKQPAKSGAGPTPTCTTAAPNAAPVAAPVKVNVYNATKRSGLAAATAKELKKRGYIIGTVSNDPLKKTIKGTAEVRYGKSGAKVAAPIESMVSKPAKIVDTRKDTSVDLVLGNAFKDLAAAPAVSTTAPPVCTTTTTSTTSTTKAS
jgi:hypothetical protein